MELRYKFDYFVKTCVKIQHPTKGLVPFELYPHQKRLTEAFSEHKLVICKKFRQAGVSTLVLVWSLWKCLNTNNTNIVILYNQDRWALEGIDRLTKIINNLPDWDWLKLKIIYNSHSLKFDNRSSIVCVSAHGLVGRKYDYLFLDEPAFMANMDKVWQNLPNKERCVALSTPNGTAGWFYNTYKEATDSKNGFHVVDINYKEHPDYNNEVWEKNMKKDLGERGFSMEVEAKFGNEDFNIYNVEGKKVILTGEKEVSKYEEQPVLNRNDKSEIPVTEDLAILSGVEKIKVIDPPGDGILNQEWFSGDSVAKAWENIAKVMPEHKKDAKACKKKKTNTFLDEMMTLCGLDDNKEEPYDNKEEPYENEDYYDKLIKYLHKDMPENMKLLFVNDNLCINEVPTKINIYDIDKAIEGLIELTGGEEEAVNAVGEVLRKKLRILF